LRVKVGERVAARVGVRAGTRVGGRADVNVLKLFSFITRPSKFEGLPLETLSSQVLEFEGKDNPIGGPFLGKLPVLSANVRLDWKIFARHKHKKFYNIDTRCNSGWESMCESICICGCEWV
jgi:hypothetical protein